MKPGRPYLRSLLLARSEWMEERVFAGAAQHGYGHLTPAMVRLFGHMGRTPVGVSEIARRMAVSRQAVHQLAVEAARLGLVELVPSEHDGRVKLLRFTREGWAMSDSAARELERIEAALAQRIGEDGVETLRRLLALAWPGDAPAAAGATG